VAPEVKICGLTRPEDAASAAGAGAAYLGAVFVNGSPRVVSARRATAIFDAAEDTPAKRAGVFAGLSAGEMLDIAGRVRLDVLQLHEPPTAELVATLRRGFAGEIWLVVRVAPDGLSEESRALFGRAVRFPATTGKEYICALSERVARHVRNGRADAPAPLRRHCRGAI